MILYRMLLSFFLLFSSYMYAESSLDLTPQERDFLASHPIIKVSNEMDWPPFDFAIGNEPSGYSIDILRLIEKKLDINFLFVNGYNWDTLWEMFEKKEIDITHPVAKLAYREQFGLYTKPLYSGKYIFITHTDTPKIKSVQDLFGKVVASPKAWGQTAYLRENFPQIELLITPTDADAKRAVKEGRAYATMGNDAVTYYSLKKEMNLDLKINSPFDEYNNGIDNDLYYLIRKDWPIFHSIFEKAFNAITIEKLEKIQKKWFGSDFLMKNVMDDGLVFTDEEELFLRNKGTIKMCTANDWMPFEGINNSGEYIGISSDIIKLLKKKSAIDIKRMPTKSWAQSLEYIQKGKCDIIPMAMKTPDRLSYMNFTPAYLYYPLVIATQTNEVFIDNLEAVKNKKIALFRGYAYTEILDDRYPNMNITKVDSMIEGLEKVRSGEVYGFIDALASIAYLIQNEGMVDLKIAGKFEDKWELSIGTRKDQPLLQSIFTKAVKNISEDEKKQIYNNWFSIGSIEKKDYTLAWQILIVSLIIALVWLFWSRRVLQAKRQTLDTLDELEKAKDVLEKIAITDKLTQLYNRNKLDEALQYEISRTKRFDRVFGVMMLDLDHFKKVNDNYGHQVGDTVLVALARILKANSRDIDIVGRWGGEEFLIICPETNLTGMKVLANAMRSAVEHHRFDVIKSLTISIGISMFRLDDTPYTLLKRVDNALYEAKNKGRNRISVIT